MAWRPTSRRFDTNPGSAGSAAAAPRYRWSASPSEAPPRTRSSAVACWHAAPRHGQPRARAAQRPGRAPTRRSSHSAPKNDPVVVPAGRSGVGKMLVAGAVEIDGGTPRRARLKVIDGFGKQELQAFVLGAVAPQTQLVTDDWPSYQNLPGVRHDAITLGPMAAHIALPWIHRLFSNLKRWGLGVYHGLRKTNLQHYLDEFVFRFNRRRTRHAAFDTLLVIGARTTPAPYRVLIRKAA